MSYSQKKNWLKVAISDNYDSKKFEVLCNTLLMRYGYSNIVPIGGVKDNARDAEIRVFEGSDLRDRIIYFQYSLQKEWKSKLKNELKKLTQTQKKKISKYIFVSSQNITGYTKDELEKEFLDNSSDFKLEILTYSWLESKILENLDILSDFFDWSDALYPQENKSTEYIPEFELNAFDRILEMYNDGYYEEVVATSENILKGKKKLSDVDRFNILKIKGWSEYLLYRYKFALRSILEALEIKTEPNIEGMHACILVEHGINARSKLSIQRGLRIFQKLTTDNPSWENYYNLGNAQSELNNYDDAILSFKKALSYNAKSAETWKNLGSVYFYIGQHDKEDEAMNKALEINPNLVEAIISKGVTALQIKSNFEEAVNYFEKAFKLSKDRTQSWPAIYHWYGIALLECGDFDQALLVIDKGLSLNPEISYLLNTKSKILSKAWRTQADQYIGKAEEHFRTIHELSTNVIDHVIELLAIYRETKNKEKFLELFTKIFDKEFQLKIRFSFDDFLLIAESFLEYQKFISANSNIGSFAIRFEKLDFTENSFDLHFEYESRLLFARLIKLFDSLDEPNISKIEGKLVELLKTYSDCVIQNTVKLYPDAISKNNLNENSKYVTEVIIEIPLLILTFISRQIGWISGYRGFNIASLPDELQGVLDFEEWQMDMVKKILETLDENFKLFSTSDKNK